MEDNVHEGERAINAYTPEHAANAMTSVSRLVPARRVLRLHDKAMLLLLLQLLHRTAFLLRMDLRVVAGEIIIGDFSGTGAGGTCLSAGFRHCLRTGQAWWGQDKLGLPLPLARNSALPGHP